MKSSGIDPDSKIFKNILDIFEIFDICSPAHTHPRGTRITPSERKSKFSKQKKILSSYDQPEAEKLENKFWPKPKIYIQNNGEKERDFLCLDNN